MVLALDGHATGTQANGTSVSAILTTINANDIIVAAIFTGGNSVSTVAGTGTTGWANRATEAPGGARRLELWYGTAAAALSSVTITASFSSTIACMSVFGISGANTSSKSDSNASLPATGASASASIPTLSGISTSNANDMIIGVCGKDIAVTETAGSTFTLIDTVSITGAFVASERKIVSVTQSSVTVAFGTSVTGGWLMIVDAIKQASAASADISLNFPMLGW